MDTQDVRVRNVTVAVTSAARVMDSSTDRDPDNVKTWENMIRLKPPIAIANVSISTVCCAGYTYDWAIDTPTARFLGNSFVLSLSILAHSVMNDVLIPSACCVGSAVELWPTHFEAVASADAARASF